MRLNNLAPVTGSSNIDIFTENGKIKYIYQQGDSVQGIPGKPVIEFDNAIVFPGLINSHEHLDFDLFPQLGNKIYNNYVEWGDDIHKQDKDIIKSIVSIPEELRVQWGIYKNLLSGVTTVINHGPKLSLCDSLITVWQKTHSLHSVQLEKKWKYKLNNPFIDKDWPVSIHVGEGNDKISYQEINQLVKWNLMKRKLIGIHGVAMNAEQAKHFQAVVWCPDSNSFLLGQTASINQLKTKTQILFGTDSTVSANWNIWEHLRLARQTGMAPDMELVEMLTASSASIWKIPDSGLLQPGYAADIVIGKKKPGVRAIDAFFALNPEDILMIIHKNSIRLFDEEFYVQLKSQGFSMKDFYKIYMGSACKYVSGNLPGLMQEIRNYKPLRSSIPEYIQY